ncbi:unnamed protein product [Phaeothamnion confervicola]
MLQPRNTKYRKQYKGRVAHFLLHQNNLQFGKCGLQALEPGYITARQIESARQTIRRKLERKGKLWIHIFPNIPVTEKPTEVRMGKGKGNVSYWATRIPAGKLLFEIDGVSLTVAYNALRSAANKLPLRVIFR